MKILIAIALVSSISVLSRTVDAHEPDCLVNRFASNNNGCVGVFQANCISGNANGQTCEVIDTVSCSDTCPLTTCDGSSAVNYLYHLMYSRQVNQCLNGQLVPVCSELLLQKSGCLPTVTTCTDTPPCGPPHTYQKSTTTIETNVLMEFNSCSGSATGAGRGVAPNVGDPLQAFLLGRIFIGDKASVSRDDRLKEYFQVMDELYPAYTEKFFDTAPYCGSSKDPITGPKGGQAAGSNPAHF